MFASVAIADDQTTPVASENVSLLSQAFPMVMVVALIYLFIIRPNQKRIKEHDNMTKSLKKGDKVVTAGGVIGTVSKIEDDKILVLEVAPEVKIRIMTDTISEVLNQTPVSNDNKPK